MAVIKLYGDIAFWNENGAERFIERLGLAAAGADRVDVHLHCYGGDVIEGNMIFNAIRGCGVPVDFYVDGIAASMAGFLLPAARRVFMAENAFVMLHAPAGGNVGRGTAEEYVRAAKVLRAMEGTAVKSLMVKTGKDEGVVREWLRGDSWFSAQEAVDVGLADGIVERIVSLERVTKTEIVNGRIGDIYNLYSACMAGGVDNRLTNKNGMDKKSLIARLGLMGVTESSSDADVEAAIVAGMGAERTAKDAAERRLKEREDEEIAAVLEGVKGRLTDEQQRAFVVIGEKAGVMALRAALKPLQERRESISDLLKKGPAGSFGGVDATGWSWDEWQRNNAGGLERLEREDFEAFGALYRAKYGKEAPKF